MNNSSNINTNQSGKRSRNKTQNSSEDEGHSSKRLKPDCCTFNDFHQLNKSRIYNFGYRKKPAELFRKDLISAMKMADTEQLNREDYWPITDSWREEWEKGVQVPVNPDTLPIANVRVLRDPVVNETHFKMPKKFIKHQSESEPTTSNYELDLLDLCWLESINECESAPSITDNQMEQVINELEQQCARNIKARQIGMEYDDHIICDVCRSPDGEEGNEMVFCDLCNICVHQACYGITEIPDDDWLCRPCKEFGSQKALSCVLCPNLGGALKPTSLANQWAHVSCALWVPEVSIGCVSTMEPITKIKQIPQTRWNLVCSLCNEKQGAPIQCSVKTCKIAYHVTCAFNHKLKMKAIVESDGSKGVKLKSYCKRHTEKGDVDDDGKAEIKAEPDDQNSKTQHEIEIATSATDEKNDDLESDFWKYIDINKAQQEISKLSQKQAQQASNTTCKSLNFFDFVLQYWKLKRTANYGASLIKLTSSAQFEEQQIQQRSDILRLRVDLERIRNLSYMICRREKVKRNWLRLHQHTVEKALTVFAGNPNTESSRNVSEESSKLVCDIIKNSFIYNYDEKEDKNRSNAIIKALKRLVKIDHIHKNRPNPYAKFYVTHVKRKQENEGLSSQTINGVPSPATPLNGSMVKVGSPNKHINGLSSSPVHMKYNSVPVNGVFNSSSPPRVSLNEKKSPLIYRQSPRSLLKPKITSPSNVINSNVDEKSSLPVLTRSSLSGYKIPKKKQEQNLQSITNTDDVAKEIEDSIQNIRRKIEPQLYTRNQHKNFNKLDYNQLSPSYQEKYNFYNSQHIRGQYMTRGKDDKKFYNRNSSEQSLLRSVSTRAQGIDEAALLASAANDVDMRRNLSFRPPLIH